MTTLKCLLKMALGSIGAVLCCTSIAQTSDFDRQIEQAKLDVPRIREILSIPADPSRPIDKRIHDELWGLLLTRVHVDPSVAGKEMRKSLIAAFDWQREFWKCMGESARSHKIVRSEALKGHRNIDSSITAHYLEYEYGMLAAAASGAPYVTKGGIAVVFDEAAIRDVRARMDVVESRALVLADPDWHAK